MCIWYDIVLKRNCFSLFLSTINEGCKSLWFYGDLSVEESVFQANKVGVGTTTTIGRCVSIIPSALLASTDLVVEQKVADAAGGKSEVGDSACEIAGAPVSFDKSILVSPCQAAREERRWRTDRKQYADTTGVVLY